MVKIRLTRTGKKHEPHYRIVAADSRSPRDGRFIEQIGYYNPRTKPPTLQYDKEVLQKWIDSGAQMTDTVFDIFVKEGIVKKSKKREKRIKLMIEESKKKAAESTEGEGADKKEQTTKEQKDKEEGKEPEAKSEEKTEEKEKKEPEKKPKDDEKKGEEKKPKKEETKPEK